MNGRDPNRLRQEDNIFMITIWRTLLDTFWSQEPVTVRGNITMLINMGTAPKEELIL